MRQLYLSRENNEGEGLLESVDSFVKNKDWVGVVQVLDQLIQNPRYVNSLAYGEDGLQFNLRERARSRLFDLPQVALDHYSRLRHVDARLLYEKAGEDTEALRRLIESYPVPLYLAKASLRLASIYFEEGRMDRVKTVLAHSSRFEHCLSDKDRKRLRRIRKLSGQWKFGSNSMKSLSLGKHLIVGSVAIAWDSQSSRDHHVLVARSLVTSKLLWRKKMGALVTTKIFAYGPTLFVIHRLGVQSMNARNGTIHWTLSWRQMDPRLGSVLQFISPDIHCVENRLIIPVVSIDQKGSGFFQYSILAIKPETGEMAWKKELGTMKGSAPSQFSMTVNRQTLYAMTDDGILAALETETGLVRWRRRYLALSSFNKRAGYKLRLLARVAPRLTALQSKDGHLYFYNAALHSLIALDQDGGALIFEERLDTRRQLASFCGSHVVYQGHDDRSSKAGCADLMLCFCQRKHFGLCSKRLQIP
ncbi:MAG: PQQ-binding-like beta-propeller repeat protein [Planctomycetota bacterium]|nr:PQQ-binding-like beta-propeller repeat protein [Planctomycetota bacterium]